MSHRHVALAALALAGCDGYLSTNEPAPADAIVTVDATHRRRAGKTRHPSLTMQGLCPIQAR